MFPFTSFVKNDKILRMKKPMKTHENTDYSKLSKEELVALLVKKSDRLSEVSRRRDELMAKNHDLTSEKDMLLARNTALTREKEQLRLEKESIQRDKEELQKENEILKDEIRQKNLIIKKLNIEGILDRSDNANMHKDLGQSHKNTTPSGRDINRTKKEKKKAGRKPGSKNFSEADLEKLSEGNEVIVEDNKDEWLAKHPGCKTVQIGEDVSYVIEYQKARYIVHKVRRPKYRTSTGEIIQAPSAAVIGHSYAGASLLAALATAKYSLGVPVYRMGSLMDEQGIHIDRNVLYRWLCRSGDVLKPVQKAMFGCLRDNSFHNIHIDETTLRVMETCDESRQKSYMFIYAADSGKRSLRLFDFTESRTTERTDEILKGYKGKITVDGFSGYSHYACQGIGIQRCLVHARREFTDICKTLSEEERKNSAAYRAVILFGKVFDADSEIRATSEDPFEILRRRQEDGFQNLVSDLDSFIMELDGQTLSKELRKAVNYYIRAKKDLWTFLEDGELTPDNNEAERTAKSFASSRRSFLFCRTTESAEECAVLVSLVRTAEANGLYPDMYLEWCMKEITRGTDPSLLMPWNPECEAFRMKEDKKEA